jgi:hypothetical protein
MSKMGYSEGLARQIEHVLDDRSLLEKLRLGLSPVESLEQSALELLELYALLSTHPAIARPRVEVISLSDWLESIRSKDSVAACD